VPVIVDWTRGYDSLACFALSVFVACLPQVRGPYDMSRLSPPPVTIPTCFRIFLGWIEQIQRFLLRSEQSLKDGIVGLLT